MIKYIIEYTIITYENLHVYQYQSDLVWQNLHINVPI